MAARAQPGPAEVGGKFEIRVAVADHGGRAELDSAVTHILLDQSGSGLTAGAAVRLQVRADKHGIELDALRAESVQDELLHPLECRARERLRAQTILVRDHDEPGTAPPELPERAQHPRQ